MSSFEIMCGAPNASVWTMSSLSLQATSSTHPHHCSWWWFLHMLGKASDGICLPRSISARTPHNTQRGRVLCNHAAWAHAFCSSRGRSTFFIINRCVCLCVYACMHICASKQWQHSSRLWWPSSNTSCEKPLWLAAQPPPGGLKRRRWRKQN